MLWGGTTSPSTHMFLNVRLILPHCRAQTSDTFILLLNIISAICRSGYPIIRNMALASVRENVSDALCGTGGMRPSVMGYRPRTFVPSLHERSLHLRRFLYAW